MFKDVKNKLKLFSFKVMFIIKQCLIQDEKYSYGWNNTNPNTVTHHSSGTTYRYHPRKKTRCISMRPPHIWLGLNGF